MGFLHGNEAADDTTDKKGIGESIRREMMSSSSNDMAGKVYPNCRGKLVLACAGASPSGHHNAFAIPPNPDKETRWLSRLLE
jgi:hypothetical protein